MADLGRDLVEAFFHENASLGGVLDSPRCLPKPALKIAWERVLLTVHITRVTLYTRYTQGSHVFRFDANPSFFFHLLEDVEHEVGRLVELVVVLEVGLLHLLLGRQLAGLLDAVYNGLGGHPPGLGGEVDALSGALGHVADTRKNKKNNW